MVSGVSARLVSKARSATRTGKELARDCATAGTRDEVAERNAVAVEKMSSSAGVLRAGDVLDSRFAEASSGCPDWWISKGIWRWRAVGELAGGGHRAVVGEHDVEVGIGLCGERGEQAARARAAGCRPATIDVVVVPPRR